jgi:hypothetical protein
MPDLLPSNIESAATRGRGELLASQGATAGIRAMRMQSGRSLRGAEASLAALLFASASLGSTTVGVHRESLDLHEVVPVFRSDTFGSRMGSAEILLRRDLARNARRRALLLHRKHFETLTSAESAELNELQSEDRRRLDAELRADLAFARQLLGR